MLERHIYLLQCFRYEAVEHGDLWSRNHLLHLSVKGKSKLGLGQPKFHAPQLPGGPRTFCAPDTFLPYSLSVDCIRSWNVLAPACTLDGLSSGHRKQLKTIPLTSLPP